MFLVLRARLASANPWRTNLPTEPLILRRKGFSPFFAAYYCQDLRWDAVYRTFQPRFYPHLTPCYQMTTVVVFRGIGNRLNPVHFRSQKAREVNCYVFLTGWLFLSLPPSCLCFLTYFVFVLSLYLGSLTLGLNCSSFGHESYTHAPVCLLLHVIHVPS